MILGELSAGAAVDLFFTRAREVKDEEKLELLRFKPDDLLLTSDLNSLT